MKNKRYLYKTMLMGSVCTFIALGGGGSAYAQDLSELVKAGTTTCTVGDSYACFKLQNDTTLANSTSGKFPASTGQIPTAGADWNSFLKNNGNFTSNADLQGQTTDDSNNVLSLDLKNTTLFLKAKKEDAWKFDGKYMMLRISSSASHKDQLLTLNAVDSLFVGNIFFTSDDTVQGRGLGKLVFSGNQTLQEGVLKNLTFPYDSPTIGASYALIGAIINNAGGQVDVAFTNGAKMFGDIRTSSASQSQTTITFAGTYKSNEYALQGLVLAGGGATNTLNFNAGNFYATPTIYKKNYGIYADSNGTNAISFSGASSQTLLALSIISNGSLRNGAYVTGAKNTITFNNGQSGNKLLAGNIRAKSATNVVLSTKNNTALDIVIDGLLISQFDTVNDTTQNADHQKNTIISNGSMQVGNVRNGSNNISSSYNGIVSYSGKNIIRLMQTDNSTNENTAYSGNSYVASRYLESTTIYASYNDTITDGLKLYGNNEISIDGDLFLGFSQKNGISGGTITASNGGVNTISLNGTIQSVDIDGEAQTVETTLENMIITATTNRYHNTTPQQTQKGVNNITINNKNNQDITLGSISATGGDNILTISGASAKTSKILSVFASYGIAINSSDNTTTQNVEGSNTITINNGNNGVIESVLSQAGGTNTIVTKDTSIVAFTNVASQGGFNNIAISGGTTITFNNITTSEEGSNRIAILRKNATSGSQTSMLNLSYGNGGTTELYLGDAKTVSTADYAKVSLGNSGTTSNLDVKVERDNSKFDVTFGNGTDFSYFFGDIDTINKGSLAPKFYVENNAIFTPNTMGRTKTQADIDLTLKAGGKMVLTNDFSISNLTVQNSANQAGDHLGNTRDLASTIIDLATGGGDYLKLSKEVGTTLTVNTLTLNGSGSGNALLRVYSGGEQSNTDKVTVTTLTATSKTLDTQVFLPLNLIGKDLSSKDLIIFSTTTGGDQLELISKEAKTGFATYTVEITKEPASGGSPTNWKLGGTSNAKVASGASDFSNVILPLNYTNWNGNINSLNKRLGELRDNPYNQGVWARVFTGEQTNSQAKAQINMSYLTLQGGYDYGIALDDARNYIGLAVSYGMSSAQSEKFYDSFNTAYEYDAKSSNIEVGLYNSYVQNSGLYTDSIFKFSYITSDFDGINASSANTTVSNYAISLGQEVGYRLKFGEKQDWYFDPQAEIVFGYFSQTDFDQAFEQQVLNSSLNALFLARARVGADLAYSLKTTKGTYDFRAGLSYVYDYVNNGNAQYSIQNSSIATLVENGVITSDQRLVLNVGTNMQINDEVRLYVDFETSFLGEIQTKYQVNAGVRYSFGEKIQVVEAEEEQENTAPLKIQDKNHKEEGDKASKE